MTVYVDLDGEDLLPLVDWLHILKLVRVWHEYQKDMNGAATARRLGISRYAVYRIIKPLS